MGCGRLEKWEEVGDLWRQSTDGCGAVILGVIIADGVIGALSGFLVLSSS